MTRPQRVECGHRRRDRLRDLVRLQGIDALLLELLGRLAGEKQVIRGVGSAHRSNGRSARTGRCQARAGTRRARDDRGADTAKTLAQPAGRPPQGAFEVLDRGHGGRLANVEPFAPLLQVVADRVCGLVLDGGREGSDSRTQHRNVLRAK